MTFHLMLIIAKVWFCSRICLVNFLILCYTPGMIKRGHLVSHDLCLESHEKMTIDFFLNLGKDIELNLPSLTPGTSNPDFWMDGLVWEMKCPFVDRNERIAFLFRHATRQSVNVIFDLRNLKVADKKVILHLQKLFKISRRVRRLMIICKDNELKIFKKS